MAHLLDQIRLWIEQIILTLHYPGIALVMLVESIFPPIPSELVMPFGGFLAARGELNIFGVWIAGTIGSVLGAVVLYGLGVWLGDPFVRFILRRYHKVLLTTEDDYVHALKFFAKFGVWAVLFGRLIPLVRSLISIPAGMERMRVSQFLLFTTLGSATWNIALGSAGLFLGSRWDEILVFVSQYERAVLVSLALSALGFAVFYFKVWRQRTPSVVASPELE